MPAGDLYTIPQPIAWGMRRNSADLKAAMDSYLIEYALTLSQGETYFADLDEIKKRKVLRVLTRNTSSTFFIYKGEQLGFEYELAQEFAKSIGVRLEMIIPPSREALFQYLESGKGDVIAAGMTRTPEREKRFLFSAPYQFVNELLIVPAKDKTTKGLPDLKGKTISVRKSSSYYETLMNFRDSLRFKIDLVPEDLETEDIMARVGAGKIAATIADSNIVQSNIPRSLLRAPSNGDSKGGGASPLVACGVNTPQAKCPGLSSNLFNSPEISAKDRIRSALASYNCGPGHIYDARDLAKQMGLDPNKWFNNVEQALLLLSKRDVAKNVRYGYCRCEEPVNYVSQIQNRYDQYVRMVPMQ